MLLSLQLAVKHQFEPLFISNTASVTLSLHPHFINGCITYKEEFNVTFRFILRFFSNPSCTLMPRGRVQTSRKICNILKRYNKSLFIKWRNHTMNYTPFSYLYSLCSQVIIKSFKCSSIHGVSKYILIIPEGWNCGFDFNSKFTLHLGLPQIGEEVMFCFVFFRSFYWNPFYCWEEN